MGAQATFMLELSDVEGVARVNVGRDARKARARAGCGGSVPRWQGFSARARAQEAEAAERSDPPMLATCRALVGVAVALGVEAEDRSRTWKADAEEALKRGWRAGPAARAPPGAPAAFSV